MIPTFTPYLWLNIVLLAFLLGLGWSIGCWLWASIVASLATLGRNP